MNKTQKKRKNDINKAYYHRHKEKIRALQKVRCEENAQLIARLKSKPCVDCGQEFPSCCMDWHHIDPKTKIFNLGTPSARTERAVRVEMAKCELICANCHRIRHYGPAQPRRHPSKAMEVVGEYKDLAENELPLEVP